MPAWQTTPIRLVVVDDHPVVRDGLVSILNESTDCRVVGSAGNAEEALEQVRACEPDVVLLDLKLGHSVRDGPRLAEALLREVPSLRILIWSNYVYDPRALGLTELGVYGYILKSDSTDALLDAIRAAHRGWEAYSPEIRRYIQDLPASRRVYTLRADLTPRELEVLQLVVDGFPTERISQRLSISDSSVRHLLTSCFQKLGVAHRTDAVLEAHRRGLIVLD